MTEVEIVAQVRVKYPVAPAKKRKRAAIEDNFGLGKFSKVADGQAAHARMALRPKSVALHLRALLRHLDGMSHIFERAVHPEFISDWFGPLFFTQGSWVWRYLPQRP